MIEERLWEQVDHQIGMRVEQPQIIGEEQLMERAVKVGADVPYCIMRGTALAEGIGEKLTRLPEVPKCYVLIGKPGINVSTKTAYENLNLEGIGKHPDIDGLIGAIRNNDLYAMASRMENFSSTKCS